MNPEAPTTAAPPPLPLRRPEPAVWGAWATVGWGFLVGWLYLLACIVVALFFALARFASGGVTDPEAIGTYLGRGEVLAVITIATTPLQIGLLILIIKLKRGSDLRHYLALKLPSVRAVLVVAGACIAMIAVFDGVALLLGRPVVAPFMVEAYVNCSSPLLLWLALVVAAPLSEELMFRSFMLRGLESSLLGPWGAVILTSIAWTALHAGYDLYALTTIFVAGLLLGGIWLRTRSVWLCVFMHGLMNLIATLETAWVAMHP